MNKYDNEFTNLENDNSKSMIDNLYNSIKNNKKSSITFYDFCDCCKSKNIIEKYGFYICQDCGSKNESIIDETQEWRYYGSNDSKSSDPSRCGIGVSDLIPNTCMGSIISANYKESKNMQIIRRIHAWNSVNYRDTTLINDFNNMEIICSNYGISKCIIEEAKYMFKNITYQKHKKKAKKEAIQAACVQWSCKLNNVPRDSNEMARMFNISKKDIRKGAKQFEEIWSVINENNKDNLYKDLEPSNSTNFLHRRCSQLKLSNDIFKICEEVCNYIEKEDYLIKHIPLSRTAGSIYFTCNCLNISVDKTKITEICSISEVTINKCYQKLNKIKDKIIQNTSLKNYY